jgi:RNA polymerase sigma factor (sigma-70 family)
VAGFDNATLLERAGQGDQLAWRQLIAQYDGLIHSVARSFRFQEADILDVAQATWLRLVQKRHTIRDPQRLAGWLAVTASRECLAILRKASTHGLDLLDAVVDETPDPASDVEAHVRDADSAAILWSAVADLPSRQRLLVLALFQEEFDSYQEVAARCTMPIGSIGPTRARALGQLRRTLERKGMGSADL